MNMTWILTEWVSYLDGRLLLRETGLLAWWALVIVGPTANVHVKAI